MMNNIGILSSRKKKAKICGTPTMCHTLKCILVTTTIILKNKLEKSYNICQLSDKKAFKFSFNVSSLLNLHTCEFV